MPSTLPEAADIAKQIEQRERNFTEFVIPRLVTATKARRSACVMIVNETKHTLHLMNADCLYGLWTVEAPGEIFPGETVLFGTEADKASHGSTTGTEASVEFIVANAAAAEGEGGGGDGGGAASAASSRCWLTWCNPMFAGERGKWWDGECNAPLRIDAICSQDDNNKVTFRLLNGSGTLSKFGRSDDSSGGGGGGGSGGGGGGDAQVVVPVLSEEEISSELLTRREVFNTQHLPQLIQAQMKANRSTMLSINNQTDAMFARSRMELSEGAWTVEPPSLLFPNETDVPFGSQSGRGLMSLVEGTLELVTDTVDAVRPHTTNERDCTRTCTRASISLPQA